MEFVETEVYIIYNIKLSKYRSSRSNLSYSDTMHNATVYTKKHYAARAAKEFEIVVSAKLAIDKTEFMFSVLGHKG